jgi:hypothetical protein
MSEGAVRSPFRGELEVSVAAKQHQVVPQPQPQAEQMGCLAAVVRLVWMMFGNIALLLCAAFVAQGKAPVVMDVAFFAVAVGLIAVRYLDITKFKGQTSEGKPATLADWRRYAAMMVIVSLALWGAARFVASRGWMS